MASAGIFEVPIGSIDPVSIDWEDWLDSLPSGQTLDVATGSFDGGDGDMSIDSETILGNVSTHVIDASEAVVGYYYLKVVAESAVGGGTDYEAPRWLRIHVVAKTFVEEVT